MYTGLLHVKCRYYFQISMKLEFSRQIFEKSSNIKFHENPSSGSRVVPCRRTDMTKLIVAFRNFANAPKNYLISFAKILKLYFLGGGHAGVVGKTKNECRIWVGNPERKRPVAKTWHLRENKILFPTAAGDLSSGTSRPSVKARPTSCCSKGTLCLFPWNTRDWGVMLTTHFQLQLGLRMIGVIPLLPLYVFRY